VKIVWCYFAWVYHWMSARVVIRILDGTRSSNRHMIFLLRNHDQKGCNVA